MVGTTATDTILIDPQAASDAELVAARRRSPAVYQHLQERVAALHPRIGGFVAWCDPLAGGPAVLAPYLRFDRHHPDAEQDSLAAALVAFVDRFRPDLPAEREGLLVPAEVRHGVSGRALLIQYTPMVGGAAVLSRGIGEETVLAKGPLVEVLATAASLHPTIT